MLTRKNSAQQKPLACELEARNVLNPVTLIATFYSEDPWMIPTKGLKYQSENSEQVQLVIPVYEEGPVVVECGVHKRGKSGTSC